jgi:tetratricopeptide (TPR) repeat protein
VTQPRRRPAARPSAKRQQRSPKRNQAILAIFGVLVVISLIVSIVGPPLVDYLTKTDPETPISVDTSGTDPVEQQYLDQISADPNDAESMAALGSYLGNTGRVEEAITWYEKAIALQPENWDIRLGFGRALANGSKRSDAELQYQKVIAARPNDAQAHFSLAQLYENWIPPRTAEAAKEYALVIAIAPDSYVSDASKEALSRMGIASPVPGSPVAQENPTEVSQ